MEFGSYGKRWIFMEGELEDMEGKVGVNRIKDGIKSRN